MPAVSRKSVAFEHVTLGQRVLFGAGQAPHHLANEVARLAAKRVMVIADDASAHIAAVVACGIDVTVNYNDVAPHVPIGKAEKARTVALDNGIDLLVSIGGGSTTGLAKAIALTTRIPIVAVPTTYAGSEATNVWGITESARKTTGVDDNVLPITVIYDVDLTMSLPLGLSIGSGMNAMAHCIDSMWAPRANPLNTALAAEGIRVLAAGLSSVKSDAHNASGREQLLYGAYLAGVAFASAGSGMHHKICHVLGGAYDLPHAETHAVILPHVLAFNTASAAELDERIAAAFGSKSATSGLDALRMHLDAPAALKDYGFEEKDIPAAAGLILPVLPASNPRPVTKTDLEKLLCAAHAGTSPGRP
jgi:maleylacetate reductase